MKCKEAMKTKDKPKWQKAVKEEHGNFTRCNVVQAVPKNEVPDDATIIGSTWAMKKKPTGTHRARLNARGFEQIEGVHYDSKNISSPVVNEVTFRIALVMMLTFQMFADILDVKSAFLHGEFENDEKIYVEVPEGFEDFYPADVLLLLLKTMCGLKQAAFAFWRELLRAMRSILFERSGADPCLYFRWTMHGLVIIISWIDDLLIIGYKENIKNTKKKSCEDWTVKMGEN